ncbi:uncharacterized protein [Branchiostoma lanceolatum]|uniref:uncharacterized protein n=1 Tax=Branchiostoma lanceolatum TaxID=7740 RepID=UPI0034553671
MPSAVIDNDRWTKVNRKKRVIEGPEWMPSVPDDVTKEWQTTCRMCSIHNDEEVWPFSQKTEESMLTYAVLGANGGTGHVIHKPSLFWEKENFKELDGYAKKAPRSLNGDFHLLVNHLVQPTRTELERARILFSWIAAQDVHHMKFPQPPPEGSPDWFLEKIKQRRTDAYRYLFSYLCRYAGLQCEFVKGHCKGARCFPGTKYVGEPPSTTWTGVCVNGQWGIVDTHWGSYSVIDDDDDKALEDLQSQISMDEFYFFPNPLHYLSSHCPEHPNWQLIENPVPLQIFEAHVKCTSAFFALRLFLLSHHNGLVHTENGQVDIYMGLPSQAITNKNLEFTYNLKTKEEQSRWRGIKLDRFVSQQRMKGAIVFTIRPPEKGKFLFEPYVGLGGSKDSFRVCEYIIVCDQAKDIADNAPLPDYKGSWGPGKEVVSKGLTPVTHPSPYVQCDDGKAEVEFKMEQDVQLTAKLFEESLNDRHLQRFVAHEVIDDVVKFHVVAPKEGNHGLAIYAKEDGEDTLLCNYITQTSSNQTQSGVPFPTVTNGLYGPVAPAFSELGLSSKSSKSAFIECDTGELDLRLGADRDLVYDSDLFWETLEEKINLYGNVFKQILDGEVQFWLRLPHLGKYRLAIYAKETGQQGDMANVINYCINCTGTKEGLGPFPVVNGKQWGRKLPTLTDLALTPVSHPTAYIQASGTLEIEFSSTERMDYTNHLKLWKMGKQQRDVGDFACHKMLNDGKTMVLLAKFPEVGEYSLELYVRDADGKDQNVMNYLINCEQSADPCQPFPEVMGRRWGPIYPCFNQLDITLSSHTDPVIVTNTRDVTIAFGTAAPLWFYPELTHHEDGKSNDLTANAAIQDDPQNNQQILAKLILPNAGYYKFSLFAKAAGANGNHQRVISYLIHCTDVAGDSAPEHTGFPQFMGCWGTGCRIVEPNTRTLPGGDSQHFKLKVPDAAGVAVILPNKKWCHLQQEEDGTWEGDVVVPLGGYTGSEVKVVAKMKEGGDSYLPLLQYVVGEDSQESILAEDEASDLLPALAAMGLSTGSHPNTSIKTNTGELDIRLGMERRLQVSHQLTLEEDGEKIDMSKHVFQETMDGELRFWLRLPAAGKYTLSVNAAEIQPQEQKSAWQDEDEGSSSASQNVINYNINCTETTKSVKPFPSVEGGQWGLVYPQALSLGVAAKSHPSAYMEASGEHEIVLDSPPQLQYTHRLQLAHRKSKIELDDYICHRVLDVGNKTVVVLRFPKRGEYTLEVRAKGEDSDTPENVANFLIRCVQATVPFEPFPAVANRRWGPLYPAFTDNALRPQSHEDPFIKAEDGNLKIAFDKSEFTTIYSSLVRCSDDGHEVDDSSYAFVQDTSDEGETFAVELRLNDTGYYKLTLFTKDTEGDNREDVLTNYLILCKHGLEESVPFPERPGGWEQGYQLHEPVVRNLKAKETVTFRGRFPGAAEVAVVLPSSQWIQLKKGADGTWEGAVTMPGNTYSGDAVTLNVLPDHDEGDYTEILRYTVEGGADGDDDDGGDLGNDVDEDEDIRQEEEYQIVLRENRQTFEDNMDPVKVIPKFEEEKFIDEEEAQEMTLQVPNNANEVNKALLNVVSREGEEAFVVLRDVLKETKQTALLDLIKDVKIDVNPDSTPEVIKKKLAEATKANNRSRIEKAIAEYNEHGLSQSEDVYKEATRTLRLLTAREDLRKAISSRQKDQLKEAMQQCSEFKDELKKELNEAKRVLDAVLHLETLRHKIMAMNQATVAELKAYNQPPPAVNQVMMTTFLLLGNSKAQIKNWQLLQTLMGKTGKQSLKRRIKKCQPAKLSPETVADARRLLHESDLTLESVRSVSNGAATFYVWSMGMIEEVEQLTKPKESAIKQLTKAR